MKEKKFIKKILFENMGWIYSKDGEIKEFEVNGEMASIVWYRQGNREFNGKYAMVVEYE